MGATIKHLAIISENYAQIARFYQALFGMTGSSGNRPEMAVSLSDGYLGLNFNPRRVGGWGRLDHFGFEIDSVEQVEARLQETYPRARLLKRPGNRPFAGLTTHDPEGNYFDLSAASMENRRDVYTQATEDHPRYVHHVELRAMNPELLCSFYRDVFDLEELEKAGDDPRYYLFDGRITLVISPWDLGDYYGGTVGGPGPDHVGFAVESLEALEKDLENIRENNPRLQPLGYGAEGKTKLRLLQTCHYGRLQLSDPDGVPIDVVKA